MKKAEAENQRKRHIGWIIDPIESFRDGGPGHQREDIMLPEHHREVWLDRPALWKVGKRAFDLIASRMEEQISLDGLELFLTGTANELISLWNQFRSPLEQMIESNFLVIYPYDSDEPIEEFRELNFNPENPWVYLHLEPYIVAIDSLFEQSSLLSDEEECWPYDRELLGAYFTLCFLDDVSAGIALNEENSEAAGWVTFWFDRIDRFNRTREVIKHQESIRKQQKSQSMNSQRHAKRNEAVQLVTDDWSQRKSDFRSAERAGKYYADWLDSKGHEYEPRTITNWIRKYAKDNGIKLR